MRLAEKLLSWYSLTGFQLALCREGPAFRSLPLDALKVVQSILRHPKVDRDTNSHAAGLLFLYFSVTELHPNTPGMSRFYDGANWTAHTSGTPLAPPLPTATASPYFVPPRPENKKANTGLTLALVSLIVNPLMILSIMAIVYGAQGNTEADSLQRAGQEPVGRKASGWAIGLGILGSILFVIVVPNYASHNF